MFRKWTALALWSGATAIYAACSSFDAASAPDSADAGDDRAAGESGVDAVVLVEAAADVVQTDAAPLPAHLLVFLSSEEHIGKFPPVAGGSVATGLSGADALCKRLADNAPRTKGRQWVAWLSWDIMGGDARTRLARNASGDLVHEYRLVDGVTVVFPKGFNFDVVPEGGVESLPAHAITVNEKEGVLQPQAVWTGTLQNGKARAANNQCGGWNLDQPDASYGAAGTSMSVAGWSYSGDAPPCTELKHLYCFETRS